MNIQLDIDLWPVAYMLELYFKCVYNCSLKYFMEAALKSSLDNSTTDIFVFVTIVLFQFEIFLVLCMMNDFSFIIVSWTFWICYECLDLI